MKKKRFLSTALVLALATFIGLSMSFIAAADTAGPVLSGISPAANTDITAKYPNFSGTGYVAIEYLATDTDKINNSSVQVKLNSKTPYSQTVTFTELSGHWEDDGDGYGPYWVVDTWDYTRATVKATFYVTNMPESNTVWTSISDQAGNNTATQWNFTFNKPPVISNQSPANGTSAYSNFPTIQARITDNGPINASSISMTVDGNTIAHTFNATTGYVTGTPSYPLAAGRHDVIVQASDTSGNSQTSSWYFNVPQGTATFSAGSPANGAIVTAWNPTISVFVTDTANLSGSKYMVVNGSPVIPSFSYLVTGGHWETVDYGEGPEQVWVTEYDFTKGTLSYTPAKLPDGLNTASVSISNSASIPSYFNWSFNVKAPPLFSALYPTGNITTDTPTVSGQITDNDTISASSIIFKIDNTVINHSYDPATKIVSGTPTAPLAGGSHTVYLEAADTSGNTGSTTWTFFIPAGNMTYTNPLPAAGTTINTWNPNITIEVSDAQRLDPATVAVTVNGKVIPASFTFKLIGGHWVTEWDEYGPYDVWVEDFDYTKGTITGQPVMISDGSNTITALIKNNYGFGTNHTWTVNVLAPPQVTNGSPPAGQTAGGQQPVISAKILENSTVASYRILVDGTEIPSSYNAATGLVSGTPAVPLIDDTNHSVQVNVTDSSGLSGSLAWTFYLNTFSDMPQNGTCTECHSGFPVPNHPMNDCNACHGNNQPVEDCRTCHGSSGTHGPEFISGWDCGSCHNSTYSYKIPLHPADNAAYHNTTQDIESCRPCHTRSLTREHYQRTDHNGQALTCATCHDSTNIQVRQAIEAKDKNCNTCHGQADHESLHTTTNVIDQKCTTCHKASLIQEHLNNPATQTDQTTGLAKPWNCDTCHNNAQALVSGALAASNKQCAACHRQAHNLGLAEKAPADIPLYSGFKWTLPLDASLWSSESWLPAEFVQGGKAVVSNRRTDLTGNAVWAFYQTQMPANGWTLATPAPASGSNFYSATFVKGARKAIIWFYGGPNHNATPVQPGGYRVEIIYR